MNRSLVTMSKPHERIALWVEEQMHKHADTENKNTSGFSSKALFGHEV